MHNIPHFPSFYIYHNYQSIVNRYIFSYLLNEYNKKRTKEQQDIPLLLLDKQQPVLI